jgi:hypothetical protein
MTQSTQEGTERPAARGKVDGYRLVVPEEWQKIPVQRGTDRAIADLLDRAFAKHGRDEVAQHRRLVEARLKKIVKTARMNAGVDLYLPLGHRERNLPASFLISYVEFGKADAPEKEKVLTELLSTTSGAVPVEVDGTRGLRTMRTFDADPEREVDYPSRRVEYILPVPRTADSWLVSSFSTFGAGSPDDEMARLLCGLFDAIMGTFRWQYQEEEA